MIHCDIKPSNLLVNQQGTVKILDMGLARLTRGRRGPDRRPDDQLLGTVDYMAPEQAWEATLGPSGRYLLAGLHVLFPAYRPSAVSRRHAGPADRQASDAAAAEHYCEAGRRPRRLVQICRKMMAKDPADRYQSAEEVSYASGGVGPEKGRCEAGQTA